MDIDYKQAYIKLVSDVLDLSNICLDGAERAMNENTGVALTLVKVSNKIMDLVGLEIANLDLANGN